MIGRIILKALLIIIALAAISYSQEYNEPEDNYSFVDLRLGNFVPDQKYQGIEFQLRAGSEHQLYGGRITRIAPTDWETDDPINEQEPAAYGIDALYGLHINKKYFGVSMMTGLGFYSGDFSSVVVPIEAEANVRVGGHPFGIVGVYSKVGYRLAAQETQGFVIGFGVVFNTSKGHSNSF